MLKGQTILITGGTGTFGQRCVERLLAKHRPRKVIIFSRDELKQHEMRQRFPEGGPSPVRYFIGDVRDKDRLYRAFEGVDVVIHTAALKQVPVCEYNPIEAVKTNVLGAANIIDAAIDCKVRKVIALSTDKAVNPTNLYGASKLCAEKLFIHGNAYVTRASTKLSCVRYGNVVASRGSVIPLFLQQRHNGIVTVTDKRMTRFWITVEQGVEFVLRCLEGMRGGELFVPKIPSMRLMDLVTAVAPKARIQFTGIRPGEKLHELLVSKDEARHTLQYPNMFVVLPSSLQHRADRLKHLGVKGVPVKDEFVYGSDNNPHQLTIPELGAMVKALGLDTAAPDRNFERWVG